MAANSTLRKYKITDGELGYFASYLCITLRRDISELSVYGLTNNDINELEILADNFKNFPTDIIFFYGGVEANDNLKALRAEILKTLHSMAMRVKIRWGADSPNYKSLEFSNPSLLSDDMLLVVSMDMLVKITEYLADLSIAGLTQTMLDDWKNLNDEYDEKRQLKAKSNSIRMEKTTERIAKGNELYALVAKYCNMGKLVYENINSPKYKAYLIYKDHKVKKKMIEENEKVLD